MHINTRSSIVVIDGIGSERKTHDLLFLLARRIEIYQRAQAVVILQARIDRFHEAVTGLRGRCKSRALVYAWLCRASSRRRLRGATARAFNSSI